MEPITTGTAKMSNGNNMIPIKLQEHCLLTDFGLDRSSMSMGAVTIESNRYVCVRDSVSGRLSVIDLTDTSNVSNMTVACESAVINPVSKTIALKTVVPVALSSCVSPNRFDKSIQVYNIDIMTAVKSYAIKSDDDIIYYEWISPAALGLVGGKSVFHWSIEDDSMPTRMFDIHSNLKGCRIVSYKTDASLKWSILIGIITAAPPDGTLYGHMQLHSAERQCSQPIEGYAACFTKFKMETNPEPSNLFVFVNKNFADKLTKLHLIEVGRPQSGNTSFMKKIVDVLAPSECTNDFPAAVIASAKHDLIYLITMFGYLHIFDVETATCVYVSRITEDTVIATAPCAIDGGVYCVDKRGRVMSISLEQNNLIAYIANVLKNDDLALKFASRDKTLKGSETVFIERFEKLFKNGRYLEAARIASEAPNEILRGENILQLFQNVSAGPQDRGSAAASPLLQYFGVLLDSGHKLNAHESMEICKRALNQNKKQLLEKWLREDKIFCTEELGDLVKKTDSVLALSVYLRAHIPDKVIRCFLECKQIEKIILYCRKIDYKPDPVNLLRETLTVLENSDEAVELAKVLIKERKHEETKVEEMNGMVNVFMERGMVKACTAFLLDVLKEDRREEGNLQTKLIEINLISGAQQVADAILGNRMFSYYDRCTVGQLCEKAGLLERALEHYTDLYDIKRAIVQTNRLNGEWLVGYFSHLSAEDALECLKAMLSTDIRTNLHLCVRICNKFYEQLTIDAVIKLFENLKCYEGLYYFLGSIVNNYRVTDENVHFKYIQSACKTGQTKEIERICRESTYYNPEKVKNYLKEIKLADQLPLIIVCDRFNFVKDLVFYLYRNNLYRYIEIFVQKVNQSRLPEVVGALLDVDCNEEPIRNLIMSMKNGQFSPNRLVEEVEKRNRLKLLSTWLESRVNEGRNDTATHDAIAKIYVDGSNNPERFLKENKYYDSIAIGKYCEKRDPHLACIAYERGKCDEEFINVCYENNLFKSAARYLVKRCDPELWNKILKSKVVEKEWGLKEDGDNDTQREGINKWKCKRQLIDQVVQTALSETHDPEEISTTVKAFMTADLPNELIEVLEKIVLDNSVFCNHKNLQNLLILTAIKCEQSRVMDYINRLDNYDSKEVAAICVNYKLHEEAFSIYKKFNFNTLAIRVLVENVKNLDRACEFAECCNEPAVWSLLGKAQLGNNFIKGGIDSFIRAEDPSSYVNVVEAATKADKWQDLVNYLQMACKITREPYIESELIYAYAKTNRLADLEEFVSTPNNADVLKIGDRCFENGMLESAKILYENISNYAKLSITLASLKEFQEAVDNARKANCTKTWKTICFLCLIEKESRLAQISGLNIVIHADQLQSLIDYYEANGYINELMDLLETALGLERAHMGIFTELSVLYARYKPEKMKEHVELFWCRVNIPKVLRAAEEAHLWPVTVFLYEKYEDYDSAVLNIIEHPTEAWKENQFKDVITKVSNAELYYKSIQFYIDYKPLAVNDLMIVLSSRIDHSRAINIFLENDLIHLIKPYLSSVQGLNNKIINQVLNDIYIDEEDYRNLKSSIDLYDNFDCIALAQKLERNDLIEFRRISAYLYKICNRWNKSIEICKRERLFKDAIKYAAESKNTNVSVELLHWFLQNDLSDHFTAGLFQCYDLLQPDVVLELAWKYKIFDFAMPYLIQTLHEYINIIDRLSSIYGSSNDNKEQQQQHQQSRKDVKETIKRQQLMVTYPPTAHYQMTSSFSSSGHSKNDSLI